MPSRADIETTLGHLALFACTGLWFGEPDELRVLVNYIAGLKAEAREKGAWEGRYNALLEETESSRPRMLNGGEDSRGAADGVIAIDAYGCAWGRIDPGCWFPLRHDPNSEVTELPEENGPYVIVYTPGEEES